MTETAPPSSSAAPPPAPPPLPAPTSPLKLTMLDAKTPGYVTTRAVALGEALFVDDEAPLVAVALVPVERGTPRARLFATDTEPVPESMSAEWTLVHLLVARTRASVTNGADVVQALARLRATLMQPGRAALAGRMATAMTRSAAAQARAHGLAAELEAVRAADDGDEGARAAELAAALETERPERVALQRVCAPLYAHIAAARKHVPELEPDEVLALYGLVRANALTMRAPLSETAYGLGVYARASLLPHACAPSARALFTTDGRMRVTAARALGADEPVTLNRYSGACRPRTPCSRACTPRYLPVDGLVRCVATAPRVMRELVDDELGHLCGCTECTACLGEMHASAASRDDGDDASGAAAAALEHLWRLPLTPALAELADTCGKTSRAARALIECPLLATLVPDVLEELLLTHTVAVDTALAGSAAHPSALALALAKIRRTSNDVAASVLARTAVPVVRALLEAQNTPVPERDARLAAWRVRIEYALAAASGVPPSAEVLGRLRDTAGSELALAHWLGIERALAMTPCVRL